MTFALLYRISVNENPHSPKVIILQKGKTYFGRRSEVSLDTINRKEISKKHAKIMYHFSHGIGEWTLKDCRSLNGTFVNFRKISKHLLRPLDIIVFGGGAGLNFGDKIDSSVDDGCQYIFLLPEITVRVQKFEKTSDNTEDTESPECAICYATMRRMETLPCNHNFCSTCISKWAKSCVDKMLPAVCPLCRTPFPRSAVSVDYLKRSTEEIIIPSFRSLKKVLGFEKDEELSELSVCKSIWDEEKRAKFWGCIKTVKKNRHQLLLFRYAVSATFHDVFEMSNDELINVVCNLGGDLTDSANLREEAMYLIAKTVNQTVKRKDHRSNPKI